MSPISTGDDPRTARHPADANAEPPDPQACTEPCGSRCAADRAVNSLQGSSPTMEHQPLI